MSSLSRRRVDQIRGVLLTIVRHLWQTSPSSSAMSCGCRWVLVVWLLHLICNDGIHWTNISTSISAGIHRIGAMASPILQVTVSLWLNTWTAAIFSWLFLIISVLRVLMEFVSSELGIAMRCPLPWVLRKHLPSAQASKDSTCILNTNTVDRSPITLLYLINLSQVNLRLLIHHFVLRRVYTEFRDIRFKVARGVGVRDRWPRAV